MKILNTLIAALFLIPLLSFGQERPMDRFFQQADAFFSKYVVDGKVAYTALKQRPALMQELALLLDEVNPGEASEKEQKALYINAYNILVIYAVITNNIRYSPKEEKGFFDSNTYVIGDEQLSLDQIEKEKLSARYKDPRVHFVLVCAADGCPSIKSYAFLPDELDQQLTNATQTAINNPDWLRVVKNEKKVYVSEIFRWYRSEFLAEAESIIDYVNMYREEPIPNTYKLDFYDYSWELNEADASK